MASAGSSHRARAPFGRMGGPVSRSQGDALDFERQALWSTTVVAPTGSAHGTSYSFRGSSSCRLEVIKGSPGDVTEAESGLLVARWHGPLLPTKPIEVPCPRGGLEL